MFRTLLLLLLCGVFSLGLGCDEPVGMENGTIPNSSLSASSQINKWHGPSEGRLNNYKGKGISTGVGAWCALKTEQSHYLQIDLGSVQNIGRIATQGRNNTSNQYVKSYKVSYSEDEVDFKVIQHLAQDKVFTGNTDKNSVVYNDLPGVGQEASIQARYIRVIPVDYNINICIRVELYKCPPPTTQPPVTTPACPECSHGCIATPEGYNCTCPSGFSIDVDGITCQDINECIDGTHQCDHNCSNTNGSYNCSCMPGYKLSDGKSCQDIDECSVNPNECAQKCVNDPGSFKCDCNSGYKLGNDGRSCNDINECSENTDGCAQTCVNSVGSFSCQCGSGYTLGSNGKSCDDINECSVNTDGCAQTCVNSVGSFSCQCSSGYTLGSDGKSCNDKDECALGTDQCDKSTTQCLNKEGTYQCPCLSGYKQLSVYKCTDINECLTGDNECVISSSYCENLIGSYQCKCRDGYEPDTRLQCKDIDECKDNNGGCSDGCTNSVGSYTCTCPVGYILDASLRNCVDKDECQDSKGGCEHLCHNTVGSFYCSCLTGYELTADKLHCTDIDECAEGNDTCDKTSTTCNNLSPSFECNCKPGYTPIVGDDRRCKANTCPALVETTGTNVSPSSCLQNNVRAVGETCVFSCEPGYELPSQQDTLTCQPSGSWDSVVISCQKISCPKLNAPANGNLFPPECETTGNVYQEKCHYSCSNGYDLNGVSVKTCGSNGQWDDQSEPTCSLSHPDPWITCPGNVIVTLSPGASTADVSALLGDPKSNQPPSSIRILPEQYNSNKIFPVGTTTITYVATNPVNRTAQCQASVLVQDKEAPKIIDCPMTIYESRESGDQAVSWTEPGITDNVGIASTSSSQKPGDTFTFGQTSVTYKAVDTSGNSASCSFNVVLKKIECVDPDPPDRGTISCGSFCSLTCDAGTKQFVSTFFLTCSNGQWNAEVPDCVDFVNLDGSNQCPDGYVKQTGMLPEKICVKCPRGRYYDTSSKTCMKCPVGYISTTEGSLQCEKCPTNSSTSVEGSKQCTAQCLPGQFSASGLNLPGSLTPCESCPNNTYQDKLGQSRCERCPNDTETLTSGSTSVSDCGGPPMVTSFEPNPTNAFENNQTQFECHGEGLPLPSFAIKKVHTEGFPGPVQVEYIQGSDGYLKGIRHIITKVTEYDAGAYSCTVTNKFGSDTKYLQVNVELDFSIGKRRRR